MLDETRGRGIVRRAVVAADKALVMLILRKMVTVVTSVLAMGNVTLSAS